MPVALLESLSAGMNKKKKKGSGKAIGRKNFAKQSK
jgi:hypothetical protein